MSEKAMMAYTHTVALSDGSVRRMDFDMGCFAQAELAYEQRFGKDVNVNEIISELAQQKTRAVMAMAFGAMISAGEKITWDQFSKSVFTFKDSAALTDAVATAVLHMYRQDDNGEGGEKNADSRGAR